VEWVVAVSRVKAAGGGQALDDQRPRLRLVVLVGDGPGGALGLVGHGQRAVLVDRGQGPGQRGQRSDLRFEVGYGAGDPLGPVP
jgi:hypothetical protein